MALAAGERRALAHIEAALRRSDPKLAAMLSTFNRLARSEQMPRREFLSAPGFGHHLRRGCHRWSPRIAALLPVVITVCALGVIVMIFAALSHVRPAGATPGQATSCRSIALAGCQPAGPTRHKR